MAMTMVGTQAPQKLFGDFPAETSQIPGMVTPDITAAMPSYVDLAGILAAQNAQREQSRASWARAAAINNARSAQQSQPQGQTSTESQTSSLPASSGMGAQNAPQASGSSGIPGFQGPVLWAPRNLTGPALGTWSEQKQKQAMAENRAPPLVLQAHVGDPYTPSEPGGTGALGAPGGGIYGPRILGGANPAVWARMWNRRSGGTSQGGPAETFPTQSLTERTSPGPKFQYDMFGGR